MCGYEDRWRLIDGKELYDIGRSCSRRRCRQKISRHCKKTSKRILRFWKEVSKEHGITSHIVIGNEQAPLVSLSSHDWLVDALPPWNQIHVVKEKKRTSHIGLEIEQAGDYEISLRRWPVEADKAINDGMYGKAFSYHSKITDRDIEQVAVIPAGAKEVIK